MNAFRTVDPWLVGVVASLATTMLAYWPGLIAGPSFDAAVFATVGWLATEGRVPYSQAWDHKPPFIYAVQWAIQTLPVGAHWWLTTVVVSSVATMGTALLLANSMAGRLVTSRTANMAAVAVAAGMAQYPLSLGGGLTETFAVLGLVGGLAIAVATARCMYLALSGALLAVAVGTSLHALPGAVAIALLVLMHLGWRCTLAVVVGGVTTSMLIAASVAMLGAGPAAVDALTGYASAYRGASSVDAAGPATAVMVLLFLIIPALLGILGIRRLSADQRAVASAMLVWLGLSLALFIGIGRFEVHYAIPVVIPLAVLGAMAIDRPPRRADRIVLPLILGIGVLASVAVSVSAATPLIATYEAENERVNRLAAIVRESTRPGSSIVVWGLEPQLYREAERTPGGRYVYLYPLITPGYSDAGQIDDELADWQRSLPAVVIDAGSFEPGAPGAPPLLISRPVKLDGRELDLLDPLRDFVRANYRLLEVVDGWPVYIRAS